MAVKYISKEGRLVCGLLNSKKRYRARSVVMRFRVHKKTPVGRVKTKADQSNLLEVESIY